MKTGSGRSAFFSLRASIALVVCVAAASPALIRPVLAFLRSDVPSKSSQRTLTSEPRVAYQKAIQEVYLRYRIWPKERLDLKPSLDAVMSQAQLEEKVADYLRNSQVLQDSDHHPITAEQLQAEMDRMAQHTKQPEVLHELFEALGNDPFVVAECLARPALVERFMTDARNERVKQMSRTHEQFVAAIGNYTLPTTGWAGCTDDSWRATTTTNAPVARDYHTGVWSGSKMIIWGGFSNNCGSGYCNTGGQYDPSTDSWTATSTTNAPDGRAYHTAVWTGSEMIVWGGAAPS